MPRPIHDCTLIPTLKSNKDRARSEKFNYRPFAMASTMSKVIELIVLEKYEDFNQLQFGFKPGSSTSLCSAMVKLVVSDYMNKGLRSLAVLIKAVDHGILFQKLQKRGLPAPILCFLLSWYQKQQMSVSWGSNSYLDSFNVSNGVRQGSVLSHFLFARFVRIWRGLLLAVVVCRCFLLRR
jgi:hypothetical protein